MPTGRMLNGANVAACRQSIETAHPACRCFSAFCTCRAVSACGDLRDMLLYTAALQQHVQAAPDVLPRQASRALSTTGWLCADFWGMSACASSAGWPQETRSKARVSTFSFHPSCLQAFLKYAIDAQCPLSFPFPADTVVVLRTGLLRHIDRCGLLLLPPCT